MLRKSSNGRLTADPLDALRGDINAIKRDLAALLGNGVDTVSGKATEAVAHATDAVRETAERAKEKASEAHERLGEFAGARPVTTIAIAAVAGIVLAKLLGTMTRD